jgi:hypothetical protein
MMTQSSSGSAARDQDAVKTYVVILPGRLLASVMKTVYFLAFVITAWNLAVAIRGHGNPFIKIAKGISDRDATVMGSITLFFTLSILAHIIRIYLNLEMLENPMSKIHKEFIDPLGKAPRFFEQSLRAALVLLVSFEIASQMGEGVGAAEFAKHSVFGAFLYVSKVLFGWLPFIPNVDIAVLKKEGIQSLSGFILYLNGIYVLLFLWDLVVIIGMSIFRLTWDGLKNHPRNTLENLKNDLWGALIKDTPFLLNNIFGMIFCLAAIALLAENASMLTEDASQLGGASTGYTAFVAIMAIATFIYAAAVSYDYVRNFREYFQVISSTLINLFNPYYGDRCEGKCFISNPGSSGGSPSPPAAKSGC